MAKRLLVLSVQMLVDDGDDAEQVKDLVVDTLGDHLINDGITADVISCDLVKEE